MDTRMLRLRLFRAARGRETAVMHDPIRIALVMDHPAQQFTQGFAASLTRARRTGSGMLLDSG